MSSYVCLLHVAIGINTEKSYGTEKPVGKGIRESGVPRSQLFVTTKLWNNFHHPDDVGKSLQKSLDELGLDYVDLFLMHWPVAWKRGDDPFPKDAQGNFVLDNTDWLEVRAFITLGENPQWI